jgi:hypothetical protein
VAPTKGTWGAAHEIDLTTSLATAGLVMNVTSNNQRTKRKSYEEAQYFNVQNPLQQREVKTTGVGQQNFTILGSVYKHRGLSYKVINPSWWLTRGINR